MVIKTAFTLATFFKYHQSYARAHRLCKIIKQFYKIFVRIGVVGYGQISDLPSVQNFHDMYRIILFFFLVNVIGIIFFLIFHALNIDILQVLVKMSLNLMTEQRRNLCMGVRRVRILFANISKDLFHLKTVRDYQVVKKQKKMVPSAYLERIRESKQENIDYCKKAQCF